MAQFQLYTAFHRLGVKYCASVSPRIPTYCSHTKLQQFSSWSYRMEFFFSFVFKYHTTYLWFMNSWCYGRKVCVYRCSENSEKKSSTRLYVHWKVQQLVMREIKKSTRQFKPWLSSHLCIVGPGYIKWCVCTKCFSIYKNCYLWKEECAGKMCVTRAHSTLYHAYTWLSEHGCHWNYEVDMKQKVSDLNY